MDGINSIPKSGIDASILKNDVSAHDVANVNTDGFQESQALQTEKSTGGTQISAIRKVDTYEGGMSNTNIADEMVEQSTNKNTLAANINVLKTQDEMNKTVIDLFG